jgi:hypothetical protein
MAMSEKLLTIRLSELHTVRFRCLQDRCAGKVVLEATLADLPRKFEYAKCPLCSSDIDPNLKGRNVLADLAEVLQAIKSMDKRMEVEFVLPDKTE